MSESCERNEWTEWNRTRSLLEVDRHKINFSRVRDVSLYVFEVLARSRRGDAVLISISLAKCLEWREQRNPLNARCALRVKHTRLSSIDVSRCTREIAGIYVTPRRTCCTRRNKAERNKGMWYNGASSDMMLHGMYVSIERYRRCSKTYYGSEYLNLNVRIPFRT